MNVELFAGTMFHLLLILGYGSCALRGFYRCWESAKVDNSSALDGLLLGLLALTLIIFSTSEIASLWVNP